MVYPTRRKAINDVASWIELIYNHARLHSALGYRTQGEAEHDLAKCIRRTDPNALWGQRTGPVKSLYTKGVTPARVVSVGTRGVNIKVVAGLAGQGIVAAFPVLEGYNPPNPF